MMLLILIIIYFWNCITSDPSRRNHHNVDCLILYCSNLVLFTIATIVYFSQSNYTVNEKDKAVQFVLVIDFLVSINLSVEVRSTDMTAKGEYLAKSLITVITMR